MPRDLFDESSGECQFDTHVTNGSLVCALQKLLSFDTSRPDLRYKDAVAPEN